MSWMTKIRVYLQPHRETLEWFDPKTAALVYTAMREQLLHYKIFNLWCKVSFLKLGYLKSTLRTLPPAEESLVIYFLYLKVHLGIVCI